MVWTVLGPLGAQIGESLHLDAAQKGMMVAIPILSGAFLRIVLGLLVDRMGGKNTGILAQLVVMGALTYACSGVCRPTGTRFSLARCSALPARVSPSRCRRPDGGIPRTCRAS
jgi:nitrate/nitrite transporter NarK